MIKKCPIFGTFTKCLGLMLSACQIHGLATSRELILSFSFSRSDVFFAHMGRVNNRGGHMSTISGLFLKKREFFWFFAKGIFDFFEGFRASSGRVLNFREERIRKFVYGGEICTVEIFEFFRSFWRRENRLIITFRNRHGFGPALKHYKGKARRYRILNLSSIGCDSAAIERSEPAGPGEQGTPGSALSDSPL